MADEPTPPSPTDLDGVANEFIREAIDGGGELETESEQLRVRRVDPYTLMRAAQVAKDMATGSDRPKTFYRTSSTRFRGRGRGF